VKLTAIGMARVGFTPLQQQQDSERGLSGLRRPFEAEDGQEGNLAVANERESRCTARRLAT
jgi:hypothetical protein